MRGQSKGQDATPGVGAEGDFFSDFFISEAELSGVDPKDREEEEEEIPAVVLEEEEEEEVIEEIEEEEEEEEEEEIPAVVLTKKKDRGAPEEEEEEEDDDLQGMISGLVDSGTLDLLDEEKEYSTGEAGLQELISDTVESRLKAGQVEAEKNRNPELVALESYLTENPESSFQDYMNASEDVNYSEVDETEPETAIYLLEDMYQLQGLDADEIAENIREHKASKSVGRHAKRAKAVLVKYQGENKKAQSQAQEVAQERAETARTVKRDKFEQRILKSDKIGGIEVDAVERQALADYILKPLDDQGNTGLMLDEEEDKDSSLLYAYIKKNKLNLNKLQIKANTKATVKFRKKLNKHTDTLAKPKRGSGTPKKESEPGDLSGLDSWTMGG